jgi:integrase-like protein
MFTDVACAHCFAPDRSQVHVRHSKAGRGRTVPLSAEGAEFFEQLTAGRPGDAPVFVRDSGAEWTRMQVSRSMQRCCAAAKIAPRAIFHDLRRSYGSLLLNAGANAEVIQELLGHADMRMTRRVYAHLLNVTIANTAKSKLPSCCAGRLNSTSLSLKASLPGGKCATRDSRLNELTPVIFIATAPPRRVRVATRRRLPWP